MSEFEPNIPAQTPKKESNWDLFRFILIAILIVVPIRYFVAQPFVVSGSSMVPTFEDKDYLIVDELSYRLGEPERGDVVVFRYPNDPSKFFIKRVIGLPNETVSIQGSKVTITNAEHPDGLVLDQPYVKNQSENDLRFEVKDDQFFVMGDNRSASSDSRYWGAVPRSLLVGRVLLRLMPLKELGLLPGKYEQVE